MKKSIIIVLIILAVLIVWSLSTYNSLITQREAYTAQWSQVENQYQRRFDLIPNLVGAVKGILKQELDVFGEIANARSKYSGAQTQSDKVLAASQTESALARLLVITENYPELKSSSLVQDLLVQLEGTENRVTVERQKYNEYIKTYNLQVQRIPGSLFAAIFGFNIQPYFEAAQGSSVAPKVDFSN